MLTSKAGLVGIQARDARSGKEQHRYSGDFKFANAVLTTP